MVAAEMNGVSRVKVDRIKGRHGDGFGLKFVERGTETGKIFRVREDREICVAAKLGRAVEHAGLAAHEQGADLVPADRGKDFAYRVRDQESLRGRDRFARAARFRANAGWV